MLVGADGVLVVVGLVLIGAGLMLVGADVVCVVACLRLAVCEEGIVRGVVGAAAGAVTYTVVVRGTANVQFLAYEVASAKKVFV